MSTSFNRDSELWGEMFALGFDAKIASRTLRQASTLTKNLVLLDLASMLRGYGPQILAANRQDVAAARVAGMSGAMLDRLRLNDDGIEAMAKGVEDIVALPDPVGRELARWTVPSGLDISRVTTSIGVIGMIYESRPNVTADAAALCLKSGNTCILRGGSEAVRTNSVIADAIFATLGTSALPVGCVQFVRSTNRGAVGMMLQGLDGAIDLIIPRGGKGLTGRVMTEARVPVLAHLEGVCHVYIHAAADPAKARAIAVNAKMRRTSVCGSAETLLIDRAVLPTLGRDVLDDLAKAGCEIRGDVEVRAAFPKAVAANDADWSTEYLDAIIAVKIVADVEDAIAHIERYGSHHTESIVTEDAAAAERFLAALDSAIVLWNASTQFADGGAFGMGAEIGIGTGKLHARGPVGVEQLTTFKYVVRGTGQIRP
jgi:glutamate-5-semialdehyde dehydrogenase